MIKCVWEHNGDDTLLYALDYPGAYTRGESLDLARSKMPTEIAAYLRWKNCSEASVAPIEIVQEKCSALQIADADSDVLFDDERLPLTAAEYNELKQLALKLKMSIKTLYIVKY